MAEQVIEIDRLKSGGPWLRVDLDDGATSLLIRTGIRAGRRVIRRLIVASPHVDAAAVKALPVGRIEAILNRPGLFDDLDEIDDRDDKLLVAIDSKLNAEAWHDLAGLPRARLTRPDGTDPEGFYQKVAIAYMEALTRTSAVAPALAEEADVPVGTVHRWIREARRRGYLGRASRGRAVKRGGPE